MTDVRRVGAVAGVVAAALVLSGCGGGSDKTDAKKPSKGPAVTASVDEPDTAEPTAEPEETEPEYPPGPEGEIDEKADTEGWEYDSLYDSASDYVQDICDSLPDQTETASPAQWLAEAGFMEDDGAKILTFGVPKLCPKWTKTVKAAVSGTYERWISRGEFDVKAKPKPFRSGDDVQEIGPGTYQAKGKFSNCYWERTTQSGNIIANQFVTQARVLTVTLRVGDLFKNDGCGTFKPVG
ncbi:hypothetical protein ACFVAF_38480 [Streptomyces sp. NPDC057596]|uniref:hypothetical protein n=1 Tax=Streptomyces sp. NPDC057596 TaxID=3346178 RepID=UPI00368304FA